MSASISRGRLARLAVERVHRHAPLRVLRVRRLDHVLLQVGVGTRAAGRRAPPASSRPRRGDPTRGRSGCRSTRDCRRGRCAGRRSACDRDRRAVVRDRGGRASADYSRPPSRWPARVQRFGGIASGDARSRRRTARRRTSCSGSDARRPPCAFLKTKSRSRPDWITSRVACHGSAGVRAPPAKTARVDVSSRRPVGCAGSSGIETGALKWHRSDPTTRWLVSTTGTRAAASSRSSVEQLPERVEHLLFDFEVVGERRRRAERRLQRCDRRRRRATRPPSSTPHATRAPSPSPPRPFLLQPSEESHAPPFTLSPCRRSGALARPRRDSLALTLQLRSPRSSSGASSRVCG